MLSKLNLNNLGKMRSQYDTQVTISFVGEKKIAMETSTRTLLQMVMLCITATDSMRA